MKGTARVLLLILPFHLISCSADGGPSGALVGLLTGGVLGAVGDELRNSDDEETSSLFGGSNNNNNNNNNGSSNNNNGSNGNGSITTVTGSKTDTNGDGVIDENDASTTTTLVGNNNNNSGNNEDDIFDKHGGLITGAIAGAAAGAITDSFRKKEIQKKYDEGYAKAKSDSIKEFYWLKRDAQKTMKDQDPPVQYRYYEVEVPAHTTSDGVLIDKHRRVIEVVE
ncbi:MAG: hypothetical protein ACAH88_19660 [Roseimicrobium sp.]